MSILETFVSLFRKVAHCRHTVFKASHEYPQLFGKSPKSVNFCFTYSNMHWLILLRFLILAWSMQYI